MAIGDAAAAAGMPVVPASKDLKLGYNDINAAMDEIANHVMSGGHTWARIGNKPKVSGMDGVTISDNAPSGGSDGDIWLEY